MAHQDSRGAVVTETERPPIVSIFMTRVDAEVWHFDGVEIASEWVPDFGEDGADRIEAAVKEAIYELGYVFDDDEPLEAEAS
jgi:hypothetical protein